MTKFCEPKVVIQLHLEVTVLKCICTRPLRNNTFRSLMFQMAFSCHLIFFSHLNQHFITISFKLYCSYLSCTWTSQTTRFSCTVISKPLSCIGGETNKGKLYLFSLSCIYFCDQHLAWINFQPLTVLEIAARTRVPVSHAKHRTHRC